jgi:NADPH dehydrogenase (quinone)
LVYPTVPISKKKYNFVNYLWKKSMPNILIVCGAQKTYICKGRFNRSLVATAQVALADKHTVRVTMVEDGYVAEEEREKWLWADTVIIQFPVFWFSCPAPLKAYMDEVFVRKIFYNNAPVYGTGGQLGGKTYMLSCTWSAEEIVFSNPDAFYGGLDVDEALIAMHKSHQYIGMEPLPTFSVHEVGDSDFEAHNARFKQHLEDVIDL